VYLSVLAFVFFRTSSGPIVILPLSAVGSRYQFRVVAVYSNHDNMHGPNSPRVRMRVSGGPSVRGPQSAPTIVEVKSISASSIFVKWQVNRTVQLTNHLITHVSARLKIADHVYMLMALHSCRLGKRPFKKLCGMGVRLCSTWRRSEEGWTGLL